VVDHGFFVETENHFGFFALYGLVHAVSFIVSHEDGFFERCVFDHERRIFPSEGLIERFSEIPVVSRF